MRYLAAWLSGNGAAAIDNLMEDAATAEISRSQIWQWVHGEVVLADTGETVTAELVRAAARRDGRSTTRTTPTTPARLFEQVALADDFATSSPCRPTS